MASDTASDEAVDQCLAINKEKIKDIDLWRKELLFASTRKRSDIALAFQDVMSWLAGRPFVLGRIVSLMDNLDPRLKFAVDWDQVL